MDMLRMLAELRAERELVEQAILTLERLVHGGARRRGRPPKWLASKEPKRRGRPPGTRMSAAARKAQSVRMKKYWAERRKQKPA
jgi:hypothetical protein